MGKLLKGKSVDRPATRIPKRLTKKKDFKTISSNSPQIRNLALKNLENSRITTKKISGLNVPHRNVPNLLPKLRGGIGESQMTCPICIEVCIYPVNTECGHFYCLPCFEEYHKISQRCCICREEIDTVMYGVSSVLKKLFEDYVDSTFDWADAEVYWNRVKDFERIEAKRRVSHRFLDGDYVDIFFRGRWREGKIIGRFKELLYVQILYHGEYRFNDVVEYPKTSRMLAKHQTFIPKAIQKKVTSTSTENNSVLREGENRQRGEDPPEITWTQNELQELQSGRIRWPSWDENMVLNPQQNLNQELLGERDNNYLMQIPDRWDDESANGEEGPQFLIMH